MIFFLISTLISILAFVTLPVNTIPLDGWYESLSFLTGENTTPESYVPITVPAYVFWLADRIGQQMQLDQENIFYLTSGFQYALVLLSVNIFYVCLKRIFNPIWSATLAVSVLVYTLAKGIPIIFMSETYTLFLTTLILYLTVLLYRRHSFAVVVVLGIAIGLLASIRVVPILFLGLCILPLLWKISLQRAVMTVLTMTVLISALIQLPRFHNFVATGSLDVASSTGKHLWQGISPIFDVETINVADGDYFRKAEIDPGFDWWSVEDNFKKYDVYTTPEEFDVLLKRTSIEFILNKPVQYLTFGTYKFLTTIVRSPGRSGWAGMGNEDAQHHLLPPLNSQYNLIDISISEKISETWSLADQVGNLAYSVVMILVCVYFISVNTFCIFRHLNWNSIATISTSGLLTIVFFGISTRLVQIESFQPLDGMRYYYQYGFTTFAVLISITITFFLVLQYLLNNSSSDNRYKTKPEELTIFTNNLAIFNFLWLSMASILFVSWQVEANQSRYALPFICYCVAMFGIIISSMGRASRKLIQNSN